MRKLFIPSIIILLSPLTSFAGDTKGDSDPSQSYLEIYQKKNLNVIRRSAGICSLE